MSIVLCFCVCLLSSRVFMSGTQLRGGIWTMVLFTVVPVRSAVRRVQSTDRGSQIGANVYSTHCWTYNACIAEYRF